MEPLYELTPRGRLAITGRPGLIGVSTSDDAIRLLARRLILKPRDIQAIQAGAKLVLTQVVRAHPIWAVALYLRDHTQAVLAGAMARGWIVAQRPA